MEVRNMSHVGRSKIVLEVKLGNDIQRDWQNLTTHLEKYSTGDKFT